MRRAALLLLFVAFAAPVRWPRSTALARR
jgi:hypothetical protein